MYPVMLLYLDVLTVAFLLLVLLALLVLLPSLAFLVFRCYLMLMPSASCDMVHLSVQLQMLTS